MTVLYTRTELHTVFKLLPIGHSNESPIQYTFYAFIFLTCSEKRIHVCERKCSWTLGTLISYPDLYFLKPTICLQQRFAFLLRSIFASGATVKRKSSPNITKRNLAFKCERFFFSLISRTIWAQENEVDISFTHARSIYAGVKTSLVAYMRKERWP